MTLLKFLTLFFLLVSLSCDTTEPPHSTTSIQLRVEDASCTEAWLKVSLTDSNQPRTIALKRDGQIVLTAQITANDSTLIDEGLLPNRGYTYHAVRMRDSVAIDASANAQLTTLDTTSHDWSFVAETLGVTSSVLYDVAIISDSNVWCVGELFLNDSSGQLDPLRYNAAHWDGNTWTILRVPYYYQGQPFYNPIQTVFAFEATDIWFAGNGVIRWNGQQYIPMPIPQSVWGSDRINKIWGRSSNDLYIVGDGGSIAHYGNTMWQRVETGTMLHVYDVFGVGGAEVYAVAAEQFVSFDKKILRITGNAVAAVSDSAIPYSLHGIWFKPGRKYYVVGSGMYFKTLIASDGPWDWLHQNVTQYYLYAIRGNGLNDILSCGSFGELIHYNGSSWRSFRTVTSISQGALYEVAIRGNVCIAVGYDSPRAVAIVGRR